MNSKDFTKIFYFVQRTKMFSRQERWFLLSLMSYQTISGIFDDEQKQKPFTVYTNKFDEYFDVDDKEFARLLSNLTLFNEVLEYNEIECKSCKAYIITIKWNVLEELRIKEYNSAKANKLTDEQIQSVLQLIKEGKIALS